MWKTIKAYIWTTFEPSREERINAAEKLLEGTGFHVHGNRGKTKQQPPLLSLAKEPITSTGLMAGVEFQERVE